MSFPQLSHRLFVSIGLPEACQEAVGTLMEPVEGIRWTRPEQLHLTLRFLGDVLEDQAQAIVDSLSRVRVESFVVALEGVGAFPPRGPKRILWTGLGSAHPRLFQLRQQVDDAILAAGWRGDMRSFEPHITVGRVLTVSPRWIDAWLKRHASFSGPTFRIPSFQLMSSELSPSGPVHQVHTRFALQA